MPKKIIVEIAEGLGNQLFMYAHSYALSKRLDCELQIDNVSGFSKKKTNLEVTKNICLINSILVKI